MGIEVQALTDQNRTHKTEKNRGVSSSYGKSNRGSNRCTDQRSNNANAGGTERSAEARLKNENGRDDRPDGTMCARCVVAQEQNRDRNEYFNRIAEYGRAALRSSGLGR